MRPNKLDRLFAVARRDESGSTLIMFAGMFAIMVIAAGAGLDYARAFGVKSALQRDLDAAVLGAATKATEDLDADGLARKYFGDNWAQKHQSGTVNLSIQNADGIIEATANVAVPMTLMKLAGFSDITVQAKSKVQFGGQDVELALVLDTTKSMEGQKLDDLKSASHQLIDTAFSFPDADEHVRVALVPFAQYVNVGLSRRNENWLDVAPDSTSTEEVCQEVTPVIGQTNCRMETATGYDDGVPYSYQYETCDYQYGPPETQCNNVTTTKTWNGCVGSRTYPLNMRDEQYSTRIPGIMNEMCSSEVQPLSSDKELVKSKILSMVAQQETYIPSGLMWGWRILSKLKPFNEGKQNNAQSANGRKVRKMLVLMSDGANTKSPNYPDHWGSSVSEADNLTLEACENIKADGIEVFTVAFDITETSVLEKMKTCASDISNFFQTTSGDQLKQAFQQIGAATRSVSLAE
jgi:Flp pilus assembly protein TadG